MLFMNEFEIDRARERWARHPVLGPASQTLSNLRDAVNANSDGWVYWPPPVRAAKKLMELIQGDDRRYYDDVRADATPKALRAALSPLKSFRTRNPGVPFEIVEVSA